MDKKRIEEFATNARKQLIHNLTYEASRIGITPNEIQEPTTEAESIQTFTIGSSTNTLYAKQIEQRNQLIEEIETHTFDVVIEKIAYTWFNRIIAIRFMEINNFLPTHTRVLSSINPEKKEPDIITEALNLDLDYTEEEIQLIYKYKTENQSDELFKLLFIKQCNKLNEILPELFETINDYTEILFNIQLSNENNIINKLITTIPEEDFTNQVEIIGWMYQYYNKELKDEIIDINNSIIVKEEIPAATQLFTTEWIVKYMVENSLGKYYIEHNPQSNLKNEFKYLITDNLEIKDEKFNVEKLKFIDPCMGSGHILSYAFDIFLKIYEDLGYYKKEIPQLILENNLYGADIDERAYQLTYFSLLLKARNNDRSIFRKNIKLNVLPYKDSNISIELLNKIKTTNNKLFKNITYLNDCFKNSREFGSLIQIPENIDVDEISKNINEINNELSNSLTDITLKNLIKNEIIPVINETKLLTNKYDFVVTNPPYMNKFSSNYKNFAKKYYKEYSKDLFSMFIYRNTLLCKKNGYSAFMTPFVWMFIKNYQKLRNYIINNLSISSLIQLEYSAFKEATVPICTFVISNSNDKNGTFIRLSDFTGGMEIQENKYLDSLNSNCEYKYVRNLTDFNIIPENPIAYWIEDSVINSFKGTKFDDISKVVMGNKTANNNKYMKFIWEIDQTKLYNKWIPCAKGGNYRKYYGNIDRVIDWSYDARTFYKNNPSSSVVSEDVLFKKGITFSSISSKGTGFRYLDNKHLFSSGGDSIINISEDIYYYCLGFLNTKIAFEYLKILNPTLNIKLYNIKNLPIIFNNNYQNIIKNLTIENIEMAKEDWDNYEYSLDFKVHPLMKYSKKLIKESFNNYSERTLNNRNLTKNNEKQINEMFSEIYNINNITTEINDVDITLSVPDKKLDIESFISYIVGCIFGRFSLDEEGLIFGGGIFDIKLYQSVVPDSDNIIPILDEEYFNDDVVNQIVNFINIAFSEEKLEENLEFIAECLDVNGKSSREVIRNYMIKKFYSNHTSMYQKCPIYWMFDSGKENAFKCLIYMHRYEPDLVSRIRFDYLHKTQRAIEDNIKLQESIINDSENKSRVNKANKKKTKLIKQLDEIKLYDLALAHVANQRIEIDLDDGVKVNYAKFQNIEVVDPNTNKTRKINLLKKI